jgi:hypothetical protein
MNDRWTILTINFQVFHIDRYEGHAMYWREISIEWNLCILFVLERILRKSSTWTAGYSCSIHEIRSWQTISFVVELFTCLSWSWRHYRSVSDIRSCLINNCLSIDWARWSSFDYLFRRSITYWVDVFLVGSLSASNTLQSIENQSVLFDNSRTMSTEKYLWIYRHRFYCICRQDNERRHMLGNWPVDWLFRAYVSLSSHAPCYEKSISCSNTFVDNFNEKCSTTTEKLAKRTDRTDSRRDE